MAFLCPVRIRRNKKKKPLDDESMHGAIPSMGRITGSASIETLVRVGIEKENGLGPESKMVVLHDFTPCVDDELEVKRGQIVHVLYQENDWVYVISEENQEGFIPHSYCAQYGSQLATLALNVKKKIPRVTPPTASTSGLSSSGFSSMAQSQSQYQPPTQTQFVSHHKGFGNNSDHLGQPFIGSDENSRSGSDGHNNTMTHSSSNPARGKVNPGLEYSDSESISDPKSSNKHNPKGQLQGNRTPVSPISEPTTQTEIQPFFKDPSGRYVVLYSYSAQDENDLSVERGQCVTVLNSDDPDWFWVKRYDQQEGFVPSGFIYPLDAIQRQQGFSINSGSACYNSMVQSHYPSPLHPQQHFPGQNFPLQHQQSGLVVQSLLSHPRPMQSHNTTWNGGSAGSSGPPSFTNIHNPQFTPTLSSVTGNSFAGDLVHSSKGLRPPSSMSAGTSLPNSSTGLVPPPSITPGPPSQNGLPSADLCYNGTELVVLYDYKAQAPDDLTVRRGDWVYADLNNQTVDGWLWTYAPKTRKYGFIPKAYAKPPAMTSL